MLKRHGSGKGACRTTVNKFRRQSKKLVMQGAQILRNEEYIQVRCNDER